MTRSLLAILRQAMEPMTVRKIAVQIVREHGLDPDQAATQWAMVANVRNALSRPREGIVPSQWADGLTT